jgi:PTH1 family peptidyl-tRNA hydrolase
MLLFAGLGNPGAEYSNNRHNVGFMAADALHRRHGFSAWSKKFQALMAEGRIGDEKVILLKPQTWMNLSGQSIGEALRFYKLGPEALTVFYDEIDLTAGKVRVKVGGGAGGHNGIRSIDQHCGKDYRRVRIGVGHPGVKELVHGHVLGDFAKADREWLEPLLGKIAEHADFIVRGDDNGFMNKLTPGSAPGKAVPPAKESGPKAETGEAKPKGKSHIRQARPQATPKLPETGPMSAMLKRLFGKK